MKRFTPIAIGYLAYQLIGLAVLFVTMFLRVISLCVGVVGCILLAGCAAVALLVVYWIMGICHAQNLQQVILATFFPPYAFYLIFKKT